MKVLLVNKIYFPEIGGIETVTQELAEGLTELGCEVEVLACVPRGPARDETINGVRVHKAASFGIAWSMPISIDLLFKYGEMARRADVVMVQHPFPLGILAALMGPRRPWTVYYHADIKRQRVANMFFSPVLRRGLERARKIFVSSASVAKNSSVLAGFRDKVSVAPYGLDLRAFSDSGELPRRSEEVKRRFGAPLVLAVGRLVPYKGIEYLIRAFRGCEGQLLILGEGPLKSELVAVARTEEIADRVHFIEVPRSENLAPYYRACDVFVLPSIAPTEAFGLVQIEAMAAGKPVINTSLPTGVPEVSVDGQSGITVPPADVEALRAAIQRLLADAPLREKFGAAGKQRAEFFSRRRFCEQIRSELEEISRR